MALLLLWLGRGAGDMSTVSFNKAVLGGQLEAWRCGAVELLPVGRGGEEKKQSSELTSASSSWQSPELLSCSWRMAEMVQ